MSFAQRMGVVVLFLLCTFAHASDDGVAKVLASQLISHDKGTRVKALDSVLSTELTISNAALRLSLLKRAAQVAIEENRGSDADRLYLSAEETPDLEAKDRSLLQYERAQVMGMSGDPELALELFLTVKSEHVANLNSGQREIVDEWIRHLRQKTESKKGQFSAASISRLKDLCEIPFRAENYHEATGLMKQWHLAGGVQKVGTAWRDTQARENKADIAFILESLEAGGPQKISLDRLKQLERAFQALPDDRTMRLLYAIGLAHLSKGQDILGMGYMKRVANQSREADFDGDLRGAAMRALVLSFDDLGNSVERDSWNSRLAKEFPQNAVSEFEPDRFVDQKAEKEGWPWLPWTPLVAALLGVVSVWRLRSARKV